MWGFSFAFVIISNMKKIIFVCHGSICRSPAAEFIMKSLSDRYEVTSRAVSYEEIGNDIYPPMKRELNRRGIKYTLHSASRISQHDYDSCDYIFYMDGSNKRYLTSMFIDKANKIYPIYAFTPEISEIEDPWYTDNYQKVCDQITQCIKDIIKHIEKDNRD